MIHLHVVFNRFIPVQLLKSAWQDQGGGIVDIRASRKCPTCFKALPCKHTDSRMPPAYKAAARYLTDELEKKYQDPHNLGYLLWKHRIRTITTSRNIKLTKSSTPIQFVGLYNTIEDALTWKDKMHREQDPLNPRPINIIETRSCLIISTTMKDPKNQIIIPASNPSTDPF
jgi:hypothetical protein